MPSNLDGALCIVTGATGGIGLATARGMARLGARVALVARSSERGQLALKDVNSVGKHPAGLLLADLSSQKQVRALAAEVVAQFEAPKILIHNAGVVTPQRIVTEDGVEMQFAVNHLAPFLLTSLLGDAMERVAPARIVVVASQVERGGVIDFSDLMGEKRYEPLRAYSQSKLANVMFTYALAERLRGSAVTANCLHPGVVRSELLNEIGNIERLRAAPRNPVLRTASAAVDTARSMARRLLMRPPLEDWALTPEEGARNTLFVATAPALAQVSGCYFSEMREKPTSVASMDRDTWQLLWNASEKLTGTG
jgi:NAD(P)-dependent dehydrogenase (short-subunit alcohol dehydrogenase family)